MINLFISLNNFRIPSKLNEFMAMIDEKEKKIRKVFGMSYIQYVNVNRQIHQKSLEDMKSRNCDENGSKFG